VDSCVQVDLNLTIHYRGSERVATPHPGVGYLVPIEAPVLQDKGKGKEVVEAMDEGKSEREISQFDHFRVCRRVPSG
jgi:hypothetical protein